MAAFDGRLATALAGVTSTPARDAGVALGRVAAQAILAARANDGSAATVPYSVGSGPGVWQPTPPAFSADPLLPQWPKVTPFGIPSTPSFRPSGPPALNSAAYTKAYGEVKSLGSADSTIRTANQTQIAEF